MDIHPRNNLSTSHKWLLGAMVAVPLALMVAKWQVLPTSATMLRVLSLQYLPEALHTRVRYILFVPFGALLVVFFRLTLGIRVLGPFRSILLAMAFHVTGILTGLVFTMIVVMSIAAFRPLLRSMRLPYFGRVSVILSAVAMILLLALLASNALGYKSLQKVAYFPIVVLCLTGEGFARTLIKEGRRSAIWRGAMTVAVAVLITWISATETFTWLLLRFPEMIVLQIAGIIAISEYANWRLLESLVPAPVKPKRPRQRRTGKRRSAKRSVKQRE